LERLIIGFAQFWERARLGTLIGAFKPTIFLSGPSPSSSPMATAPGVTARPGRAWPSMVPRLPFVLGLVLGGKTGVSAWPSLATIPSLFWRSD